MLQGEVLVFFINITNGIVDKHNQPYTYIYTRENKNKIIIQDAEKKSSLDFHFE